MSDGTTLRHAGSAQDTPGVRVSYGVQMFTGLGNSKLCDACGNAHSLGTGWTKYGPGRILWRCPRCSVERAARKAGGGGVSTDLVDAELVDDASAFFAPVNSDLVDTLLAQYRAMRIKVERVAAVMSGPDLEGALHYYAQAAAANERHLSANTVESLFDLPAALAHLNAGFWSRALQLTDVLDLMPQKRRNEWHEQISHPLGVKRDRYASDYITPPIPEFNEENVRSTLSGLMRMRSRFFAERVDGIFQALSRTHVTNAPEGFGRRMILQRAVDEWGIPSHSTCGVINDLRCVIARFMGREEPGHGMTTPVVRYARQRRGEWITVDSGALRVRCYAVGTAHLEVHPDMAWRLNCVLAQLHPLAIPSQFRAQPRKKLKGFQMLGRPLPFTVLSVLSHLEEALDRNPAANGPLGFRENTWVKVPGCWEFRYSSNNGAQAVEEAGRVLESIGGTPVSRTRWAFDYDPREVVSEIVASGCIPDQRAHQFYPTPPSLARELVELANIGEADTVLEPSAGIGGLADLLPKGRTTCVEISDLHCKVLDAKGNRWMQGDFLLTEFVDKFDRVVMNPPFSEGRWQAHLQAAARLLAIGGRLAAILPSSARTKAAELLPGMTVQVHGQFDNAFPGASVSVVMVTAEG